MLVGRSYSSIADILGKLDRENMTSNHSEIWDAVIVGAGAAGLMCAATAGLAGQRVIVIEHTQKIAEKIRISGGGRCNFTHLHSTPANFLSNNKHYCRSALSRYTPQDFVNLVDRYKIDWVEKTEGQLFARDSAQQIIDMLVDQTQQAQVKIQRQTTITQVEHRDNRFHLTCEAEGKLQHLQARQLVVASGGKSIPKIGATGWGYTVADQFDLKVTPTRAALVPLTFAGTLLDDMKSLSGVSIPEVSVSCGAGSFQDAALFTHRGLSGPAILQISSYWEEGEGLSLDLLPREGVAESLKALKASGKKQLLSTVLKAKLPQRLIEGLSQEIGADPTLQDASHKLIEQWGERINHWRVIPSGSEGYRTAEVTLGGVDTAALSSKTMAAKEIPGLYFIGEVVDVTGHLGGHNFQWAWASGYAAGQAIAQY